MKFREGDLVTLIGNTADETNVPQGTEGEIIMIHPKGYYEVWFPGPGLKPEAVSTVKGDNLVLAKRLERTA